jgi:hypothetical protein
VGEEEGKYSSPSFITRISDPKLTKRDPSETHENHNGEE